jgi:Fibronectin type III domain
MRRVLTNLVLVLSLIVGLPARARAADIMLAWDPVVDPHVVGYIIEYGLATGPFAVSIAVGNQTSWTLTGAADGVSYRFRVRAYTSEGVESDPSNELTAPNAPSTSAPADTTAASSCTTPDPFAGLGGGTCYNGGWLPPGMPVPDGGTTTSTTTTTVTSSSASCTTADPFAGMGGGTCYNGGWLPPGMPVPDGGTTASAPPPPPPSSGPVYTPPTVSSPSTCSTPDPFAGMGGGTCYNGGWLPPGMPVPGGGTTASAPPPPPPSSGPVYTPPTVSSPSTCSTPDPFAGMGGGTCYNGGWLPPGMTVPGGGTFTSGTPPPPSAPISTTPGTCTTPDPFVAIAGLIGVCENGGWVPFSAHGGTVFQNSNLDWEITGDDGMTYVPADALPDAFQTYGLRVIYAGVPVGTRNGLTVIQIVAIEIR